MGQVELRFVFKMGALTACMRTEENVPANNELFMVGKRRTRIMGTMVSGR